MADATTAEISSIVRGIFGLDDHGDPVEPSGVAAATAAANALSAVRASDPVILFLAANPIDSDRIRVGAEQQIIRDRLIATKHGQRFDLEYEPAAIFRDLAGYLLRATPTVLHFSGHGSVDGIALEDAGGQTRLVSTRALDRLFALPAIRRRLRLVVLNACYSAVQGQAIASHVDCVIGMGRKVPDTTASAFADGLYLGLGSGLDVKASFDLAVAQIDLESLPGDDIPILLSRPGVDPNTVRPLDESEPVAVPVERAAEDARMGPLAEVMLPELGLRQVGNRQWTWHGVLPTNLDNAFSVVDQALRRMQVGNIEQRTRSLIVAKTGGLFNGKIGPTEEMSISFEAVANGTRLAIGSRSIAMQVSDFGRNQANIRSLLAHLGVQP